MKKIFLFSVVIIAASCCYGQKIYNASLLIDAKAGVGETPFWHPREKKLYWIDMLTKKR